MTACTCQAQSGPKECATIHAHRLSYGVGEPHHHLHLSTQTREQRSTTITHALWSQQVPPLFTFANPSKAVGGCSLHTCSHVLANYVENATMVSISHSISSEHLQLSPIPLVNAPRSTNEYPSYIIQAFFQSARFLFLFFSESWSEQDYTWTFQKEDPSLGPLDINPIGFPSQTFCCLIFFMPDVEYWPFSLSGVVPVWWDPSHCVLLHGDFL